MLYYYFRTPGLGSSEQAKIQHAAHELVANAQLVKLEAEWCFVIDSGDHKLSDEEHAKLQWLLSETFEPNNFQSASFLKAETSTTTQHLIEVGPRLSFTTAWSTNATTICSACGIPSIRRIERTKRILFSFEKSIERQQLSQLVETLHDRMTEQVYDKPLTSFQSLVQPQPWTTVPILEEGRAALEKLNSSLGLALDDWDLDYYTRLFKDDIKRNPTTVECFDISQSNSEHSRHWFFKGRLVIDGQEQPGSLLDMVMETLERHKTNSTIGFRDNSSAIRGYSLQTLSPLDPTRPSSLIARQVDYDVTFTAETHNFPTGVAPFPGAETGTGGRLRDGHATGKGSLVIAGTVGYSVGNLHIPGYELPWEDKSWAYPAKFAKPLQIEIEASNGASDYGNKFGEPAINGFTRSVGLRLPNNERREYIKPIMFTGGIGQMAHEHMNKEAPDTTMLVVKLGGPAYRIGLGGGAASSMVQGQNVQELDFNAVQRGDAEMENKLNRVIRTCVELGPANPIVSIHDQGAGGNANVLKEIVDPAGATIKVRKVPIGDDSLSVLEIWGAEYQENDALLIRKSNAGVFEQICKRENTNFAFVGEVDGSGRITLHDERDNSTPVNLELEKVLGKMPRKTFQCAKFAPLLKPFSCPEGLNIESILDRVLRLLAVGSKRFLTNKVDRCVTGLIAQQQCVGPLHIPLCDYGVVAQSFLGVTGGATAVGEQPIKGLINPEAMARLSLGEAMTNLVWARVTGRDHIKASGNWMWPAKLEGEGDAIFRACKALRDVLLELGPAIDGGKDSLSMAAKVKEEPEMVRAPGTLVVSLYCTMPDITKKVTPDLKEPGQSQLLFVDLGNGKNRIGGSAFAQVYSQVGNCSPDLDSATEFAAAWDIVQTLVEKQLILAGHDRSDGGLLVALLEMAFTGNCGIEITVPKEICSSADPAAANNTWLSSVVFPLFSEELGLVLEVSNDHLAAVQDAFAKSGVQVHNLGFTTVEQTVVLKHSTGELLRQPMSLLRDIWEATSFALEERQANPECVRQEKQGLKNRRSPPLKATFKAEETPNAIIQHPIDKKHRVAVIREEGSNGDREMAGAFFAAGFDPWDVTMSDLLAGRVELSQFKGVAFVGGFSYADVMDSAKGWAGAIRFNPCLLEQFKAFYYRKDTFSLGVCNGCQLMALLEWVPFGPNSKLPMQEQPRFVRNASERFESRFVSLRVEQSPALMLRGMEGSILGVWSCHGEGRAMFPNPATLTKVIEQHLAPLRYVDDEGHPTTQYPLNPNGSPLGIASLCSPDGRHLAIMPHAERTFLQWQLPWQPRNSSWSSQTPSLASPWLKMFQNARLWVEASL